MREVTVETLRGEIIRLGAVVTQTRVLHLSGARLHAPGSVLGSAEIRSLQETGIKTLYFLEANETEQAAQGELATESVEVFSLAVGDVLAQDLMDHTGRPALKAGRIIDPVMLQGGIPGGTGLIKIKRRGLRAGGEEQVKSYLSRLGPPPPRAPRPDSRVMRTPDASPAPLKVLLAPRARILVGIADNFQRSLMLNTYASEGHEVFDRRWPVPHGDLHQMKLDALVIDLAEAPAALPLLRKTDLFRSVGVLVAGAEDRKAEFYKALAAGANGSIPMPPRRDVQLERLRGTLQALGKRVTVKPSVVKDRRAEQREGGHFVCQIADPFLKTPLPIRQVTVLDLGETGMRVEYARPAWPQPHAYLAHGVHPQHFCFNYAKDNPLGRDLVVTMPPAGGREMQVSAKFVHVSVNADYETAGLLFHRVKGSVRGHISTVRGQIAPTSRISSPSTTRRAF